MKRISVIATLLVSLFFLCGIGSALAEGRPFITKWECKKGEDVPIPIVGTYKMLITDASGQEKVNETVTVADANHPYIFKPTEDGIYTVTAGPEGVECIQTENRNYLELLEVVQFGTVVWKSMEEAFQRCERMTFAENIDTPNLSKVTNMSNMFFECNAFNSSLKGWDVSHVTNMFCMFYNCTSFNQPLTGWDVSKVTDMGQMFYGCTSFNQPLTGWDVSKVTDMGQMFYGCTSFNQPLTGWDVSHVTDMWGMFFKCTSFNQSLTGWDVSNVTDMSQMFSGCTSFNQPLTRWDVSKVTNMRFMFMGCTSFNQSLTGWDVSNVTDMNQMFDGCTSFNQPLTRWDVSKVTNMSFMFMGCTSFNQSLGTWKIKTVVDGLGTTAMNIENYSNTLVGWAKWAKEADVKDLNFNKVQGRIFNAKGKEARQQLIDAYGWKFEGDREQQFFAVELQQPANGTIAIEGKDDAALQAVGEETELTVLNTPNEGYELKEILVNDKKLEGNKFLVRAATTVTAVFVLKTFPVTKELKGVTKGEITITGATNLDAVEYGTELTVEATTKEEGYELKEIQVNGTKLEGKMFKVTGVAKVTAVFGLKTFKVEKTHEGEGTLTITGFENLEVVPYGTELTVEATPDAGYELKELKANDVDIKATMKFKVTAATTVTAVFGLKTFKVEEKKEGKGTLTIKGFESLEVVPYGTELTVEATPDAGYELKELKANDVDILATMKFKVTAATTVMAVFGLKTFKVEEKKEGKGTLTITGFENLEVVPYGTELTVEATPDAGYELKELKANDVDIKATMKFKVTAATTVTAVFEKKQGNAVEDTVLANITVAPNPFSAQLRILNPEGITLRYELVNQMGAVLRSGVINSHEEVVDTEALPAGLYFVRLMGQGNTRKTIKLSK